AFGAIAVELAPLGDPSGVRAAIATPLAATDPDKLSELIGDRQLLIVLDNCEHVIDMAAAVVEDLLERCPHLHVLATSREPLRVVVDWSYDLLFDPQRRVFERLSVIPGGCTLSTAEVLCAHDDLAADEVEEALDALVDKSLVVARATPTGVRFTQLQTLAEY